MCALITYIICARACIYIYIYICECFAYEFVCVCIRYYLCYNLLIMFFSSSTFYSVSIISNKPHILINWVVTSRSRVDEKDWCMVVGRVVEQLVLRHRIPYPPLHCRSIKQEDISLVFSVQYISHWNLLIFLWQSMDRISCSVSFGEAFYRRDAGNKA